MLPKNDFRAHGSRFLFQPGSPQGAGDIDASSLGHEMWSSSGSGILSIRSTSGRTIRTTITGL